VTTPAESSLGIQVPARSHGGLDILGVLAVSQILGRNADTVKVAEEVDSAVIDALLDELALLLLLPEGLHEWGVIPLVVLAHDLLNVDRSLLSVVEWNGRDEMMADVRADNVVEQVGVDEAKITINGCSGTAGKRPCGVGVMGKASVSVLEESDGDCKKKN
jgi:hypothetical protein